MLYCLHFSSINLSSQSGNSSRKEKEKQGAVVVMHLNWSNFFKQ
jgi:hypothetical protein